MKPQSLISNVYSNSFRPSHAHMELLLPLLLLQILLLIHTSTSDRSNVSINCTPRHGDCSFYLTCVEHHVPCGRSGYVRQYGYKYCQRFRFHAPLFSRRGRKWLWQVMTCLQAELAAALNLDTNDIVPSSFNDTQPTCASIKETAFESHTKCYTEVTPSVCFLNGMDMLLISKIIRQDLLGYDTMKGTIEVLEVCEHQWTKFLRL